ncbi:MAG: TRAP transporter fused permease subunit [Clostridiales bacterium]|nr:TRAP transporter fused permease subunit [Clostridiales bacterium]MDO4350247.1 TRAP transporter fused permease subunit [Eubacteriales bacterium]MDY4009813.1 TRAP transporter fused permease subunit [Candidatus Limiplasma sp.]
MSEERKDVGFFEYFLESKKLTPHSVMALGLSALAMLMTLYFLMTAYFGAPVGIAHRLIFVLFVLLFAFFLFPTKRKKWYDRFNWFFAWDLFLALCTLGVGVYFLSDLNGWQMRFFQPSAADTVAGTILIVLVLIVTRRTVGTTMTVVAAFFILHTRFANYFPGFLKTVPTNWKRMVDVLVSDQGILSEPIQSMASYIILFLVFGALLEQTGAGRYFIDLAYSIGGRFTAGPAKTAAISSALFGSISGSSVSNVVSTGCFTIPLMKSVGYTSEEAGAIEAVASTGGNYMPPIMGAVAFIMAQYLKVPYITIVKDAVIPAVLYYIALMATIHFNGKLKNLTPTDKEKLPSFWLTLKNGGHLLLSLVVLVYFLIRGYTAVMAAFWGILVLFLLSFIRKNTRITPRRMIAAFEKVTKTAVTVGMACACAGIIVGCMFSSGLSARLSSIIIEAAGGSLVLTLIYTALISLVLGCGMPSVGVYLVLVTTVIPAIIELGVAPVAAHFFAFYFAVVSNITPPVCVAAFAGAAIAEASPMRTGIKAFLYGIATYIIPFLFVYDNGILWQGGAMDILAGVAHGLVAVLALSSCVNGYLFKRMSILERLAMFAVAVLMVIPSAACDYVGYGLAAVLCLLQTREINSGFFLIKRGQA